MIHLRGSILINTSEVLISLWLNIQMTLKLIDILRNISLCSTHLMKYGAQKTAMLHFPITDLVFLK